MGLRDEQKQFRATKGATGLRDKLEAGEMGIKLTQGFYKYKGEEIANQADNTRASTTHADGQKRLPGQSEFDLDGKTPAKYSDNLPK